MIRTFASLIAAVAIAGAMVAPASAERITQTTSISVSYADLDLNRVEGVITLSKRLERAADRVCGKIQRGMTYRMQREVTSCREASVAKAVAAIDAPLLTAFYAPTDNGTRFAGL